MRLAPKHILNASAASLCALVLLFTGTATASVSSMIRDCTDDGSLQGNYSPGALRNAIPQVPTDTDEYYSCADMFRQALLKNSTKSNHHEASSADEKAAHDALTTRDQRRKIRATVEKTANIGPSGKLGQSGLDAAAQTAAASTAAPGVPASLILAAIGLLLIAGTDLIGRFGGSSGARKLLNGFRRRGDS